MFYFLGNQNFSIDESGGKASNLHSIVRAGFQVPPGFVIPPKDDLSLISDNDLNEAIHQLGGWPVAVRSSGSLEDLKNASFAGQYTSYLNISTIQQLREKIQECRESSQSPRVEAYAKAQGLNAGISQISVLIQKMVNPEYSGVGFSIHPLSGKEEQIFVEVCHGLGEKLVSGQITPTSYTLDLYTGEIIQRESGAENVHLSQYDLQNLTHSISNLQSHFGEPQDVEWALDQTGALWVLQSRPISKIQWRSDVDEYSNADLKDGGISARICTPLMFSFYRDATQKCMPQYFEKIRLRSKAAKSENWMETFYGRVYWNASAVKRALG